jgi:iron complex outermembrane recepter protein
MKRCEDGLSPYLARAAMAASLGFGMCAATMPVVAAEEAVEEELAEVQITGSRIVRQDYVSPNPVTTLDAEQLERLGIVNMGEALTSQIPANVSSFQPRAQGGNPFFVGSTLANLRGLNPYFGTRTLTLVDGHRFVPTNQGQSVDLNVVPAMLVQRMEVVTGGASAAYGSDAVSGVVNVILDKKLEGLKFQADYGTTQRGDGDNYHFGLATGTSLFEGRGHMIVGAEYQKMASIDDCSAARKWCGKSETLLVNGGNGFEAVGSPYVPRDPTKPYRYRVTDARLNQINANGVIFNRTGNAITALSSNAAGNGTTPFAIGQFGTLDPNATALGGDGASINAVTSLYPDLERLTAYTRMSFDFTDNTTGYVEASHASVDALVTQSGPGLTTTSRCVNSDYAYLTGALGTAVSAAVGNDPRFFGGCAPTQTLVRKDWNEQIDRYVSTNTRTDRIVAGLEGAFGDSSWRWDAYYQFGQTVRDQLLNDNITNVRMDMALDAVMDGGQAVCRVTRDGVQPPFPGGPIDPARAALAVGCVPVNLFGNGALTPAQHAYVFGNLTEHNKITQDVLAFNVNGELWQGWGAGPLYGAAGVEYREEKLTNDAGDVPFYQRTDFAAQYGDSFAGRTQVKEAYATLEMSLLKDLAFAKDLRLNVAGRRTSNKTVDDLVATNPATKTTITTWKLGGVWDATDWLRIRGSRSRDLRAAGFRELYYSQSIPAGPPGGFGGGVSNPWLPPTPFGAAFDSAVTILSGNTSLKPEKASTTTVGFVVSPGGWAQGMHFSADWYSIKLVDGISGGIASKTIDRCYAGDQFYCSQIVGTPGGAGLTNPGPDGSYGFSDITELRAPYENGRPYRAEGLDLAWDHNIAMSDLFDGAPGNLLLRVSATRALKTTIETLVFRFPNLEYEARNVVGQVGPAGFLADYAPSPKWAGNFTASYLNGPLTLTLQTQWTGSGRINNEAPFTGPDQAGYDPLVAGSVDSNKVGNYLNFNLNGSYSLPVEQLDTELFFTVSNLFDKDPPYAASGGFAGGIGGTNGTFYDTLGRSFRVGARLKF